MEREIVMRRETSFSRAGAGNLSCVPNVACESDDYGTPCGHQKIRIIITKIILIMVMMISIIMMISIMMIMILIMAMTIIITTMTVMITIMKE